jgi:hypothetical protein
LDNFIKNLFTLMFRLVLMVAGFIFIASLMAAGLLLLVVWLLRALFARLTGRPVTPWAFQMNRQAVWSRFYKTPGQTSEANHRPADVIDAEVKEVKETRFLDR